MKNSWSKENNYLRRDFEFADFKEAMIFINKVAELAEEMNHHPDWSNSYNKLTIKLFTHDKNSITEKDYSLAKAIDNLV